MGPLTHQSAVLALAGEQHHVVSHEQLLALGLTRDAIRHLLDAGWLHRIFRGVYAVGRPDLSRKGEIMAGVLACGPSAFASHASAIEVVDIGDPPEDGEIHVSVTTDVAHEHPGLLIHRRSNLPAWAITRHDGMRTSHPALMLVDVATGVTRSRLEWMVNEADRLDLIDPESLLRQLRDLRGFRGVGILRTLLDRVTFTLTESALESRFLPLAARAGLAKPLTGAMVSGFRVDFYWPDLGLVVETDGLRYHRTPAQQARDRLRDQQHSAGGLTPLRFTHAQVAYDEAYVVRTLRAVARRLAR